MRQKLTNPLKLRRVPSLIWVKFRIPAELAEEARSKVEMHKRFQEAAATIGHINLRHFLAHKGEKEKRSEILDTASAAIGDWQSVRTDTIAGDYLLSMLTGKSR